MNNEYYLWSVIDACYEPRQAETEENIDRVAPCDIANCIIRVFLVHGRRSTREKVRKWRTKRNERNSFQKINYYSRY